MRLEDITATDWSISIAQQGEVVTDLEDIKQCLYILLMTKKGTAPFRPFFGCDWFDKVGQPMNLVAASIVNDIRDSIKKWEPRIVLKNVTFHFGRVDKSSIVFRIYWEPIAGTKRGQENTMSFAITKGQILLVNDFNQYIQTEYGIIEL